MPDPVIQAPDFDQILLETGSVATADGMRLIYNLLVRRLRSTGPSGSSSSGGGSVTLVSINAGTITIANGSASNTATIPAVLLANTVLFPLGVRGTDAGTMNRFHARLELTNTTTVTAIRAGDADSMTGALIVSYLVMEFAPGVINSVQRGTVTLAAVTSNTAGLSAVDLTKTFVIHLGTVSPQPQGNRSMTTLVLTNATTLTVTRGDATDTIISGYQVVELAP